MVADPGGVGVLDGDGVGGRHDGRGEVHHASPLVGGVVTGDAAYNVECSRAASRYRVTHLLGKKPPIDFVPTALAAGGPLL